VKNDFEDRAKRRYGHGVEPDKDGGRDSSGTTSPEIPAIDTLSIVSCATKRKRSRAAKGNARNREAVKEY
jgi:hypothetical protein